MNKIIGKIGGAIAKNGTQIALVTIVVIVAIILTSRYKDRAYKEFLKKHDKETAERLRVEFNKELDILKCKFNKELNNFNNKLNEEKYKQQVRDLCYRYNISAQKVVG